MSGARVVRRDTQRCARCSAPPVPQHRRAPPLNFTPSTPPRPLPRPLSLPSEAFAAVQEAAVNSKGFMQLPDVYINQVGLHKRGDIAAMLTLHQPPAPRAFPTSSFTTVCIQFRRSHSFFLLPYTSLLF